MTVLRVLALLMEDHDRPLVLERSEVVRQRLLRCNGVADGYLAKLAIFLVLDQVTIALLDSFDLWSAEVLGRSIRFLSKTGLPRFLDSGIASVSGTGSTTTSANVFDGD